MLINQLQASRTAAREHQQAAEKAREEAEGLEQEWRQRLGELERKEAKLREQRGEEAFEKLRKIWQEIDRLCERAPSRRLLLEGLGQIRESLQGQLEKSPQAERSPR